MKKERAFWVVVFGLIVSTVAYAGVIVHGQLVDASAENLSSDPTAHTGRLYLNTGSSTLKFYTGAAWRTVADTVTAISSGRLINTTAPITGGGDLSADRTIAISAAGVGTAGSVSYEDASTFSASFTGPRSYSATVSYTRIGRAIVLSFPRDNTANCTVSTHFSAAAGQVPTDLRPSHQAFFPVFVVDGGAAQSTPGVLGVFADGSLEIDKTQSSGNFSGTTNPCGMYESTVTFYK